MVLLKPSYMVNSLCYHDKLNWLRWKILRGTYVVVCCLASVGPSHGSALRWHIRLKISLDVARFYI
jgi:hypothetical protein